MNCKISFKNNFSENIFLTISQVVKQQITPIAISIQLNVYVNKKCA